MFNGKIQFMTSPDLLQSPGAAPAPLIDASKPNFLGASLKEQLVGPALDEQRGRLVQAVGGWENASRVDLWNGMRDHLGQVAHADITNQLIENRNAWEYRTSDDPDPFKRAFISVALDQNDSTNPKITGVGVDMVDFAVGPTPQSLSEESLRDPATLVKAAKTLDLLLAVGSYKLAKWENGSQLRHTMHLLNEWMKVPGFEPNPATLARARHAATVGLAALQADARSKPNYTYTRPERSNLLRTLHNALHDMVRAEQLPFSTSLVMAPQARNQE